jgi:DNA primase
VSVIDEIKQRVDIVEVVSWYVPGLKKAGRSFKASCPFHAEKTPSFVVFPERQSWHCFGACATGGDAFSFVMRKEGVDFGEALRILAQRAGVSLAPLQRGESQGEVQRLKEINEAAAEFYHHLLLHSQAGQQARNYLAQRGVSEKTIGDFQLGFSLGSWEALRDELTRKGYREDELLAAGLLVEKEQERVYDRFRNRLMFPIRGADGRVVGFGARALDDSLPKYLNSPQTPVFDKSSTLYGIDRAKSAIRKQNLAIVVEGYMDVITAHQYGFNNVVASLGTSLTERQVGIVKKLTKNLTLALDADAAGEMAMLRGQEVISQTFGQPMSVSGWTDVKYENPYDADWKVVILPPGKDPDDIIRESAEQWQHLVTQATPVIEYVFSMVASKLDLTDLRGKSSAVDQLLPVVKEIRDPVSQAHYLQKLSRLVGVDERELASALRRLKGLARPKQKREVEQPSILISSLLLRDPLAEYCLSLLVHYPHLRSLSLGLSPDFFHHSEARQLFLAWRDSADLDAMRSGLDGFLQEYLGRLIEKSFPPMSDREQEEALDDCICRMRERWLKDLKAKEEALISDLQAEGSTAELEELQQLGVKLNTQLCEVFLHGKERKTKEQRYKE